MANEQIVTELIVDARGAVAGTQQYEAALKSAAAATDTFVASQQREAQGATAAGAAAGDAGSKIEASGRAYSSAQRNLNAYLGSLDPVFFATQRLGSEQKNLAAALSTLDRQFAAGAVSVDQYQQRARLLGGRIGEIAAASQGLAAGTVSAKTALSAVSAETDKATRSFGLNRQGLLSLQASGVNAFQALASGISAFRVAETEGAQVLGAFVQGGALTLRTILAWAAPLAAAAAAFGVLAVGISRAVERESDVRSFGVALRTLGTDGLVTAQQLQETIEKLRGLGIPAADARAALLDIVRTPGINPAFGGQIVTLAHDLAAFAGDASKTEDWTKKIAAAFGGGVESVIKFAGSFNGLSAAEIANIREIGLHQGAAAALQKAFDDLRLHVKPADDSLSKAGQAAKDLRKEWNSLILSLSNSDEIAGLIDNFGRLVGLLDKAVGLLDKAAGLNNQFSSDIGSIMDLPGNIVGTVGRTVAAAIARMRAAQQDTMADALRLRGASQAEIDRVLSGGAPAAAGPRLAPGGAVGGASWPFANLPMTTALPSATLDETMRATRATPFSLAGTPFPTLGGATITTATPTQSAEIKKQHDEIARTIEVQKQWDAQSAITAARQKAEADALKLQLSAEDRKLFIDNAVTAAQQKQSIELGKAATLQSMATAGTIKAAAAYDASAVAGLREEAMQRARIQALQSGGDVTAIATRELEANAAAAIIAGARQVDVASRSAAANQSIAAAAQQGAAAEREAQQAAAAGAQTQDALTKATASRNQTLIDAAQKLQDEALAQIKANDAAQASIAISNQTHDLADRQRVLELELSLQGQTSDEIAKQVALLQAKQAIEKSGLPITDATAQAYLSQTAALANVNTALNEAQRSQQALEEGVRGIADTIDQSIGQSIQDAFDNKKTLDWGQTLRNVLAQIVNQIAQIALIRPAIGSVLSALGFASASQQFGTFGSLFSALGGAGGGGAPAASSGGGINTGTLLQGGGLLKDVFGFGGGGITGGINSFGANFLGLANPALQGPTLSGATLGETGLLGGTSLSALAGSPGGGFAAGSLQEGLIA